MSFQHSKQQAVQKSIETKLYDAFAPHELQVINESHQHNVPDGAESHFRILLVSDEFNDLRKIQRQQKVYQVLAEEMAGSVHALTMQTLTLPEWQADSTIAISPECMGGSET